ncbi:class I SAM-dependent methyltransferase [Candidatus Pacearchaeota archaeon]|nr:class I SAM-dependent methyltransferase [Candidatus Pacearchaeota archaeon]
MQSQKKVWDDIANEWHEFKKKPAFNSQEFLKKQKGKILDFGSGSGRNMLKIKDGEMYLVDFSKNMIALAKQKAKQEKIKTKFKIADMTKLPYDDNFFDSAISISSIHCLKPAEQKKAIKELYRVMKSKTQALIGVWNRNSKRFKKIKQNERYIGWTDKGIRYYYLFEEKEVHDLFKKTGFKIISKHNSEMMINFVVEK